jgi:hypothetical protein
LFGRGYWIEDLGFRKSSQRRENGFVGTAIRFVAGRATKHSPVFTGSPAGLFAACRATPRLAGMRLPEYGYDSSISMGIDMKASVLSFRAAVLMVIAGMIWGIAMGISQDHSTLPAHAHLNLLGWVSLFLFGIYYHLHPAVDLNRLATVQVWVWIAGTIILTIGVGLVHSGHEIGDPIAAVSSLIVLADTLLFGWLVFRREPAERTSPRSTVPAE